MKNKANDRYCKERIPEWIRVAASCFLYRACLSLTLTLPLSLSPSSPTSLSVSLSHYPPHRSKKEKLYLLSHTADFFGKIIYNEYLKQLIGKENFLSKNSGCTLLK